MIQWFAAKIQVAIRRLFFLHLYDVYIELPHRIWYSKQDIMRISIHRNEVNFKKKKWIRRDISPI